ncbi:unnamed protein product [Trichobilharzia szidati]|nr:unnamed protein product [Trichobilharzia szidati]
MCLADSWARYSVLREQSSICKPFHQLDSLQSASHFNHSKVNKTFLSCGTDEHGSKVNRAASACNLDPLQYCNQMSPLFKDLCHATHVNYNDFIRTTESRHMSAVQAFWKRLTDSGHLYRSKYSGWYCTSDEAFYMPWEIETSSPSSASLSKGGPVAKETGNPVEWVEEDNYVFRISSFKNDLHSWLDSGVFPKSSTQSIWTEIAHGMVDTIQDVSVSRPKSRLNWGIPVPGDDQQVIYVWLDALINYLTVTGFPWSDDDGNSKRILWPPDVQFLGKDILRFHAVLWPALLMATDLPLPKRLICHHHLLVENIKMSKSKGNHIDPMTEQYDLLSEEVKHLTPAESDVLRYVLLRQPLLSFDGSYSREMAKKLVNTELVNWIGNLLSRITSEALNPEQSIIQLDRKDVDDIFSHDELDADFLNSLESLSHRFDKLWWDELQPHNAIEEVLRVIRQANAFITRHTPWHEKDSLRRQCILSVVAEALRICGFLLQPVIPNLSLRLLNRLGVYNSEADGDKQSSNVCGKLRVLGENNEKFLRKL